MKHLIVLLVFLMGASYSLPAQSGGMIYCYAEPLSRADAMEFGGFYTKGHDFSKDALYLPGHLRFVQVGDEEYLAFVINTRNISDSVEKQLQDARYLISKSDFKISKDVLMQFRASKKVQGIIKKGKYKITQQVDDDGTQYTILFIKAK